MKTFVDKSVPGRYFLQQDIEYLCQKYKEQMKNVATKIKLITP